MIALLWLMVVNTVAFAIFWYLRSTYELADPMFAWGLLAVPLASAWYLWKREARKPSVKLPSLSSIAEAGELDIVSAIKPLPFALSLVGLGILLASMTRPQSKDEWQDVTREGIDIVIALDISASMLAKDFKPNRLESSKEVAMKFIDGRPNDRIGLVVYEGESFTQCPLTTDHEVLKDLFFKVKSGLIQGGTAIGMGLANSINRLRDSEAKSKVVILLTDGVSNRGTIQPLDAAQIAMTYGIRVYTIGVGSMGRALSPVGIYPNGSYRYDYVDVEIDEETLMKISDMTDGRYFRADNEKKLRDIYKEIDKLEKTRIKVTEHSRRNEEYFPFAMAGGMLFLLGLVLDNTLLRSMP